MSFVGVEGASGVGVPWHDQREPRVLEEWDGTGTARYTAGLRREARCHSRRCRDLLQPQGPFSRIFLLYWFVFTCV